LKIKGEDVKNYIHCPEKVGASQRMGQQYIGEGKRFGFKKADREVLTALKALCSMF